MRRKDREMSREFALSTVDACEYAVLSMTLADGTPYGVPLSIVRDGETVYFHCARSGAKLDALRLHPAVSLACVGSSARATDDFTTAFESAIVFGTAAEVLDDAEKICALRLLCEHHTPTNMAAFDETIRSSLKATGVWKISICEITGKCRPKDTPTPAKKA